MQFRLTLELVLLSVLGLCGVSVWTGWQLEQLLVASHKQALGHLAARIPEQVELSSQEQSLDRSLERAMATVKAPGLVAWVEDPQGRVLARSPNDLSQIRQARLVASLRDVPTRPKVMSFDDRAYVLCGSPLLVHGKVVGDLYLARDITLEQQKLTQSLRTLLLLSLLGSVLLGSAIYGRIRQAMLPLKAMSAAAARVSADDLQGPTLMLQQAPSEVLGLAQAFNAMLSRLSVSWEQQREFVGNVSHELRTPLTVVAGYLQSLQRQSSHLNETQLQAVQTAAAETERAIRLLRDLLELARADSGQLAVHLLPTRLNTLMAESAAMGQQVSRRTIRLHLPDQEIVASADQERLLQVLLNLFDNAFKYSPDGSPLDVTLVQADPCALIHVQDHGIGIPLAHQQRVFERFYRVSEGMTRGRDGVGLGLAIAKALTEAMEGVLTVRSQPGHGSVFTIRLPLWRP
ncbi:MAG: HAMP domain-containing sensor histidine kinase [Cyanobium sp.]|nr:HAMP domain-containing sensor histidine kinase [Cyanobium sp.]